MKHLAYIIFALSLLTEPTLTQAAVSPRYNKSFDAKNTKKEDIIKSESGLNIKDWGIAIDATFNPELDQIVPGYHILTIVLTNRRGEPIRLNPKSDRWVVIDSLGKKHTAINHVKEFDEDLWAKFPKKLQNLLDYPHVVNPGKSTTIDVFVSKSIDLHNFREVVWRSDHFNKEFNIFTNYEKNLAIPSSHNEFETPTNTVSEDQVLQQIQQNENQGFDEVITPQNSKFKNNPHIGEILDSTNKQPTQNPTPTQDGFIRIK